MVKMSSIAEAGDTKSSDKGKSKDRKKPKKSSPREQTLSPALQDRLERVRAASAEDILSVDNNRVNNHDSRNGRYQNHQNHYDSKYGHNRALSPAESLSSIHDAQFYNDRIRCLESEKLSIMIEHNNLMKEFNRMMESHLEEVRNLKEANMHYEQECHDLKDLSVFLDDDRKKCRKLAKEWQRFGRHTVSVMRSEVMGYQEKVRTLETKQTELIKENGELRDLCVYLDSQRTGANGVEGEISGALKYFVCQECSTMKKNTGEVSKTGIMKGSFKNDYSADQVHDLQNQILQLEKEKDSLHKLLMFGGKSRRDKKRVSFSVPTDEEYDSSSTISEADRLDFPPSFGGSNDNFNTIMEASMGAGILRNGTFPNAAKLKFSNISPRNSDLTRLHLTNHNTLVPLSEDEVTEIRGKLSRTTKGEDTLSEREINKLKRMCNIASGKLRSDSNASNTSFNNSFDQSPISPPPPVNGIPLYNPNPTTNINGDVINKQSNGPKGREQKNVADVIITPDVEPPDHERAPLPSYEEMVQRNGSADKSNVTEPNVEASPKVEEDPVTAGS